MKENNKYYHCSVGPGSPDTLYAVNQEAKDLLETQNIPVESGSARSPELALVVGFFTASGKGIDGLKILEKAGFERGYEIARIAMEL